MTEIKGQMDNLVTIVRLQQPSPMVNFKYKHGVCF